MDLIVYRIGFEPHEPMPFSLEDNQLTLEYRHSPAVIAAKHPLWMKYFASTPGLVGEGAAGCWIAHHELWKDIATTGKDNCIYLVLEDDAKFTNFGHKYLTSTLLKMGSSSWDVLHLGHGLIGDFLAGSEERLIHRMLRPLKRALKKMKPIYMPGFSNRTHAYAITRKGAKTLYDLGLDLSVPVDDWMVAMSGQGKTKARTILQPLFLSTDRPSFVDTVGR